MTRAKSRPPVHKPVFDEESVLRFVRSAEVSGHPATGKGTRQPEPQAEAGRLPLNLMLKPEVVARLESEAARKEKSVAQIVEKLIVKHLGKH